MWAASNGNSGYSIGYRMSNCDTIDAVPSLSGSLTARQRQDALVAQPLTGYFGDDVVAMTLFRHDMATGMFNAALRCRNQPDYQCALEIREFFIQPIHPLQTCMCARVA